MDFVVVVPLSGCTMAVLEFVDSRAEVDRDSVISGRSPRTNRNSIQPRLTCNELQPHPPTGWRGRRRADRGPAGLEAFGREGDAGADIVPLGVLFKVVCCSPSCSE
eukprot:11865023-Alexandrium_andersonii.AAC.1